MAPPSTLSRPSAGEVLAAWDELRARTREEGEAVALSPAFRETLDRHGALLKRAALVHGPSADPSSACWPIAPGSAKAR